MIYIPESCRGMGIVGELDGCGAYQLFTLSSSYALSDYEVIYRIHRLVQEEKLPFLEKTLSSFEQVILWCACWIESDNDSDKEIIFRKVFCTGNDSLSQYIFSSRKEEIEQYRDYYHKIKSQNDSLGEKNIYGYAVLDTKMEDTKTHIPYVVSFSDDDKDYQEFLIESTEISENDLARIAERMVYFWGKGEKEKCNDLQSNEVLFYSACLTELTLIAAPMFGTIPFTEERIAKLLPIVAKKVEKDIFQKYKEEIKSSFEICVDLLDA